MPLTIKNGRIFDVESDAVVIQRNYGFKDRVISKYPELYDCTNPFRQINFNSEQYDIQQNPDEVKRSYYKIDFPKGLFSFGIRIFEIDTFIKYIFIADQVIWGYPSGGERFHRNTLISIQMMRRCIKTILELAEDRGIKTLTIPLMGLGRDGFPIEWAGISTIQSIEEYLQESGDKLNVTLVISENGLPDELTCDEGFIFPDYMRYLSMIKEKELSDVSRSTKAILHNLYASGLRMSDAVNAQVEQEQNIMRIKKVFQSNRELYIMQNPGFSYEKYGQELQEDFFEKYTDNLHKKLSFLNSPIIYTAIDNYRKGLINKLPKQIIIKLAIFMELPLYDFCHFIWATGDEFPYDSADYAVLEQVRKMKFNYELNLSDDYEMLYQYVDALNELYLQNNQFFAEQNKGCTAEIYGKEQQYDIITGTMEKREISANKIAEETGMSRTTIKKYVDQVTEKLDKFTAIRIAVVLKLPLEEFCIVVWGSGAVFPGDDAERVILQCVCNEIYDPDIIDRKLEPLTDKRIYSENHKQKEQNS